MNRLKETSGPTILPIGAVAAGQVLKRVGNHLVGADPSGASSATTTSQGVVELAANGAVGDAVQVQATADAAL